MTRNKVEIISSSTIKRRKKSSRYKSRYRSRYSSREKRDDKYSSRKGNIGSHNERNIDDKKDREAAR